MHVQLTWLLHVPRMSRLSCSWCVPYINMADALCIFNMPHILLVPLVRNHKTLSNYLTGPIIIQLDTLPFIYSWKIVLDHSYIRSYICTYYVLNVYILNTFICSI